jgi:hypothetical protein
VVLDEARVAQPPALPSAQETAIMAFVAAPLAEDEAVVATLIRPWQAVVPSQRVSPLAALALC